MTTTTTNSTDTNSTDTDLTDTTTTDKTIDLKIDEYGNPIEYDAEGNAITYEPTVFDELNGLKIFCTQNLTRSKLLPTEHLGLLVEPILAIEKMLGVPPQAAFIKANFGKTGFQGFRYPDLALFNGKISAFWHGEIYDVEDFFVNQKGRPECEFSVSSENRLSVRFMHPELPETNLLPLMVYTIPIKKEDLDPMKLIRNVKMLKSIMAPYVFSTSYLKDGRYVVSSVEEKNKSFVATLLDGREFYITEYIANNLKAANQNWKPQALIVDGERTDAQGNVWQNLYVEGFPPSITLAKFVEGIYKELGLDMIPNEAVPQPIVADLLGIQETSARTTKSGYNIPEGFVLILRWNGKTYNVKPNTAIKSQKKNNLFKLQSFKGVKIHIQSTGLYKTTIQDTEVTYTTINFQWSIPEECRAKNKGLNGLINALKDSIN